MEENKSKSKAGQTSSKKMKSKPTAKEKQTIAPKAKPTKKTSASAFAKSAFEDKMSQAIKESISKRKTNNRTYNPVIIAKLKDIIANYTESPELLENMETNTDENFLSLLNIDSVDFVEIIVDSEEAFKIKLEDDKIKKLTSFDDLYDLIELQIKESQNTK